MTLLAAAQQTGLALKSCTRFYRVGYEAVKAAPAIQLLKDDVQDNSDHIRKRHSHVNRSVVSIYVNFVITILNCIRQIVAKQRKQGRSQDRPLWHAKLHR